MVILKRTEEIKTYSESEAREVIDQIRAEAHEGNYSINSIGYTHKEKKAKG